MKQRIIHTHKIYVCHVCFTLNNHHLWTRPNAVWLSPRWWSQVCDFFVRAFFLIRHELCICHILYQNTTFIRKLSGLNFCQNFAVCFLFSYIMKICAKWPFCVLRGNGPEKKDHINIFVMLICSILIQCFWNGLRPI